MGRKKLYKQKILIDITDEMLTYIDTQAIKQATSRNQIIRNIIAKEIEIK